MGFRLARRETEPGQNVISLVPLPLALGAVKDVGGVLVILIAEGRDEGSEITLAPGTGEDASRSIHLANLRSDLLGRRWPIQTRVQQQERVSHGSMVARMFESVLRSELWISGARRKTANPN